MVYHRIFAYFVIVLIYISAPLTARAQETVASQDVSTAKADAGRDAEAEVNPYIWFGHGCLISCSGAAIGYENMRQNHNILVGIGVYLLTTSAAITEVYFRPLAPPPERFIGKSPEYINTYISTYKAKSGRRKAKWTAAGCLGGTCLNGAMLYASLYIISIFKFTPG